MTETVTEAMIEAGKAELWKLADTEGDDKAFERAASRIYLAMSRASQPVDTGVGSSLYNGIFCEHGYGKCEICEGVTPPLDSEAVERVRRTVARAEDDGWFEIGGGGYNIDIADLRALLSLANPVGGEDIALLIGQAEFLCARLRDMDFTDPKLAERDFFGHVGPAHARLERTLTAMKGNGDA